MHPRLSWGTAGEGRLTTVRDSDTKEGAAPVIAPNSAQGLKLILRAFPSANQRGSERGI